MNTYIKKFKEIGIRDTPKVGGKNSSLGEMFSNLSSKGIAVPDGFATTAYAFEEFLTQNVLHSKLDDLIHQLDRNNYENLNETGAKARKLMFAGELSQKLQSSILQAYKELCGENDCEVAVRSSATAEDLPQASFAGQHESYLNIRGSVALDRRGKNFTFNR